MASGSGPTTTGIFSTSGFTQDQAKKSFASLITRLMPNGQAPLFGMTSMLASDTAMQVEHGFFTKTMIFPQFTLNANMSATDTIITVTDTKALIGNMLMRIQSTGEQILINSVLSPTQIAIQRGVGGVAPASALSGVNAYQVGTAFEESSYRPNAIAINAVRVTNLTQIFRNTWAISGSAEATQMLVGDTNVAENKQDCASLHAVDIEKGLFWSQKSVSTRNQQPLRTMDGLYSIISNIAYYPATYSSPNITTAGSTTNYTQFEAAFDPAFNQTTDPKGANERVLFVGGVARKAINNIGRNNGTYYMVDGQTSYGLQFQTIKIARGTFRLIEHPLFNSNADWGKVAFAVDLNSFSLAYLMGRKTQYKSFNQTGDGEAADNGIDAVGGTLTTELTTVIKNPPANAWMGNLTAGVAG
jgi:hypothetical protein